MTALLLVLALAPGDFAYESIRLEIEDRTPEIRRCFQPALDAQPGLKGVLEMQWIIGAKGGVQQIRTLRTPRLLPLDVIDCMTDAIVAARFLPVAEGGVIVVRWQWLLAAEGAAADALVFEQGGLSAADVERTLLTNFPDLARCGRRTKTSGALRLRVAVRADGVVETADVSAPSPELQSCVRDAVIAWRFSTPVKGTKPAFRLELSL